MRRILSEGLRRKDGVARRNRGAGATARIDDCRETCGRYEIELRQRSTEALGGTGGGGEDGAGSADHEVS